MQTTAFVYPLVFAHANFTVQVMKIVLITPHQGLGDHLLCIAIYREYSRKYGRVFITVRRDYYRELRFILGDLYNITLIPLPNNHLLRFTLLIQRAALFFRIQVVGLGGYGENFLESDRRFDHDFYSQAQLDFELRWSSFSTPRDVEKEDRLFRLFRCSEAPYIFLHEDSSRGFKINRKFLPAGLRIIEPKANNLIYNLVDYRKVIEGAREIHVIESSFAAYIEGLPLSMPLFAHRYARPETFKDYRYEFTYKKPWKILKKGISTLN